MRLLLNEGLKTSAPLFLWTENQKQVLQTRLHHLSEEDKTFQAVKPKDTDPDDFKKVIDCYFNLTLNRANLFFKSPLVGISGDGLNFKIPEKIFKVQRRNFFRIQTKEVALMEVSFIHPHALSTKVVKNLIDLGEGGLSFLVSDEEETLFQVGMILKEVSFNLTGKKISCDGEVRQVQTFSVHSHYRGVKIGIRFQHLKAAMAQQIAAFIFGESRKYLTKFL